MTFKVLIVGKEKSKVVWENWEKINPVDYFGNKKYTISQYISKPQYLSLLGQKMSLAMNSVVNQILMAPSMITNGR